MNERDLMGECNEWKLWKTSSGRYSLYRNNKCRKSNMTNDTAYYYWMAILRKKGVLGNTPGLQDISEEKVRKHGKKKVPPVMNASSFFLRVPGNINLKLLEETYSRKSSSPYGVEGGNITENLGWVLDPTSSGKGGRRKS